MYEQSKSAKVIHLIYFLENSHNDTWFQFEGSRGTVRDDGTAIAVTAGHTLDALKYGVRRAGNTIGQVLTFGYAGPQLIPAM